MNPTEIFGQQANTGTVSFEELENAFKTPTQRQADYEQQPSSSPGTDLPSSLTNPENEQLDYEAQEETEVSPEKAQRTGERIARIIDTGIDFTLSNFVAHNDQSYKADEKDLEDIAQCWGEISQEHNWNIGPEWSLVFLYLIVYGPLVKQALTDRKMAFLEERQALLENRMRIMEQQQQQPANVQMPANDGNAAANPSPFGYHPAQ